LAVPNPALPQPESFGGGHRPTFLLPHGNTGLRRSWYGPAPHARPNLEHDLERRGQQRPYIRRNLGH